MRRTGFTTICSMHSTSMASICGAGPCWRGRRRCAPSFRESIPICISASISKGPARTSSPKPAAWASKGSSPRERTQSRSGRTEAWLKEKCINEQEFVIGGFTYQPKHPERLAALLIGVYENKELIFAGKVGTGFDRAESARLVKRLEPLAQKTPSFKAVPNLARRGAIWIKPKLVAQINFTEWTGGNSLRHPSYQGLREDKPAEQVVREKKKRLNPKAAGPIKFVG
jgi:ATP dependent DNA ligase C terminal region